MTAFELNRLMAYDEASVLLEIQRVATLVESPVLTQREFDRHAKVSASHIRHRFGSWQQALEKAGLVDRYSGRTISGKMRNQISRKMTDDELLDEIRVVAKDLVTMSLSQEELNASSRINARAAINRFGTWKAALKKAGISLSRHGQRFTDHDYFENLLTVWTFHGRQPRFREMNDPPSQITAGAYEKKWGTWRKALLAFIERVNLDTRSDTANRREPVASSKPHTSGKRRPNVRSIPIGLRYNILRRDRFRCVLCGATQATLVGCFLHVDHILPVARGGKTDSHNLRTLCQDCNLGKSDKIEVESET